MKKILLLVIALAAAPTLAVVPSPTNRVTYTAAGGTTFSFSFKTFVSTDIAAFVNNVQQMTGVSVTLNANQDSSPGGTVTFTTAPTVGATVRIDRVQALTQDSIWINAGKPKTLENELDKREMHVQQVDRRVGDAETTHATDKATQVARDAAQDAQEAADIAYVRSKLGTAGGSIGDSTTVQASGSSVARALNTRFGERANVKDFGAMGDGTTNDTTAVAAAYTSRVGKGGELYFPPGIYKFNLTITEAGLKVVCGPGAEPTGSQASWRGVVFVPNDIHTPVITIGDGVSVKQNISIDGCSFRGGRGAGAGADGDGLYIIGAQHVSIINSKFGWFPRDNWHVTSTPGVNSAWVDFVNVQSEAGGRSSGHWSQGSNTTAWTTAQHIVNGGIVASADSTYALMLEGVPLDLVNTYVDMPGGPSGGYNGGTVFVGDKNGQFSTITGTSTRFDGWQTPKENYTVVEVSGMAAAKVFGNYIQGSALTLTGKFKWGDGTYSFAPIGGASSGGMESFHYGVHAWYGVLDNLYFPDQTVEKWNGDLPALHVYRADFGGGVPTLRLDGGSMKLTNAGASLKVENASLQNEGLYVGGNAIVGARQTGWTAGVGSANKGAFNSGTADAAACAQRILAIEQALRNHGLIN